MILNFPDALECPIIYGPVQSRRHGKSLGINLGVSDKKICTWGCLYCQCGLGARRDIEVNDREEVSAIEILARICEATKKYADLDSITFAGNSEPSAHPEFLELVKDVLKLRSKLKASWTINCLSNGSELDREKVVQACNLLDETWVKLDCATDTLFLRLNRPIARIGGVDDHVNRFKKLSTLYIQTLVWSSPERPILSNWIPENQTALLRLYADLRPKKIHLTTLSRAPAISYLKSVPKSELLAFSTQIEKLGLAVEIFE